jgi:hypothetical protein
MPEPFWVKTVSVAYTYAGEIEPLRTIIIETTDRHTILKYLFSSSVLMY